MTPTLPHPGEPSQWRTLPSPSPIMSHLPPSPTHLYLKKSPLGGECQATWDRWRQETKPQTQTQER